MHYRRRSTYAGDPGASAPPPEWPLARGIAGAPKAPSDGFGGITVPVAELDLDAEARKYAEDFVREENTGNYWAGATDYRFCRAEVLALEAFRLTNGGLLGDPLNPDSRLVPAMLRKAAEEYERAVEEERNR